MQKTFCNGCGRGPLKREEAKAVKVVEASLSGYDKAASEQMATDRKTDGVLCTLCVSALHAFVGEPDEDDDAASVDAAHVVLAEPAAV